MDPGVWIKRANGAQTIAKHHPKQNTNTKLPFNDRRIYIDMNISLEMSRLVYLSLDCGLCQLRDCDWFGYRVDTFMILVLKKKEASRDVSNIVLGWEDRMWMVWMEYYVKWGPSFCVWFRSVIAGSPISKEKHISN